MASSKQNELGLQAENRHLKEMVGALLDRLRHRCTTVRVEGESLRTPED